MNVADFTSAPNNALCGTGDAGCQVFRCNSGACQATQRCAGATPQCAEETAVCQCTQTPDSCAGLVTNRVCLDTGACGCVAQSDCATGQQCDDGRCVACTSLTSCGRDCGDCNTLPAVGPGAYRRCTSSTRVLAEACSVTACAPGLGNCNSTNADGCEQDLLNSATHCSACGVACTTGACTQAQCGCSTGADCPFGQMCSGTQCVCADDLQCIPDAGYTCALDRCGP